MDSGDKNGTLVQKVKREDGSLIPKQEETRSLEQTKEEGSLIPELETSGSVEQTTDQVSVATATVELSRNIFNMSCSNIEPHAFISDKKWYLSTKLT